MKKQIIALSGAIAIAAVGFTGGAIINNAEAQSADRPPVILVVDRGQLISQSKAGKTIPEQAQKVKSSVEKELEAEAGKLKEEIDSFQKNSSLMSDEVRQKTQQDLAARSQYGLPQRVQIMEQAFSGVVQQAQAKILVESQPILKEIVERRGATVLLDRASVMYAAPETDVTQEVISALDKEFPSVELQKISLAEIEKQIKEAQEAQAKARSQNN
ncbi:OmpH family outer membrane protein [Hyphococcus flavus]|uniref:OmpH family outer membrane protein n=1 Tax=Hyphococcus flavus TaxID=1866326 RepID=A0AAE9ZAZ0_9PROT|nr:OmpH family outer membrane protein [Hyphococcus flavus]WDI31039.1 OmpH family outer membrane protein [Hyphococcus flavus]